MSVILTWKLNHSGSPCKGSWPHLQELQEEFGSQGLVVLAVSDESEEKVAKYIDDLGVKVRTAAGSTTNKLWGNTF